MLFRSRCLAKAPEERPASALEVAAEFSEALLWQPTRPSTAAPSAEDRTGIYLTDPGGRAAPAQVSGPPPIPDEEEDAESTAKTAVLPRLDMVPGDTQPEEVPTLRDDHEVKTLYVGEVQESRLPVGWIVFAVVAVFLGLATGVFLSMTGGDKPRPDSGAAVAAQTEPDEGAGEPAEPRAPQEPGTKPDPVASALPPDSGAPDRAPAPTPDAEVPTVASAPDLSPAPKPRVKRRRPVKRRWRRPRRPARPPRPPQPKPKVVEKAPPAKVVVNVSSLYQDNFVTANIYLDRKYMGADAPGHARREGGDSPGGGKAERI